MDKHLDSFREMISLRGLTDHILTNYCTYIRAYLDYLTDILHKSPEDVSWNELRDYIRCMGKILSPYTFSLKFRELVQLEKITFRADLFQKVNLLF